MVERGPKGSAKFGLRVTHPDFYAGRMLVLACDSLDDQKAWFDTLTDCSRVTMENALLGDSVIEKLRAQGTAVEKERAAALGTHDVIRVHAAAAMRVTRLRSRARLACDTRAVRPPRSAPSIHSLLVSSPRPVTHIPHSPPSHAATAHPRAALVVAPLQTRCSSRPWRCARSARRS
jgi:hypothetical protein